MPEKCCRREKKIIAEGNDAAVFFELETKAQLKRTTYGIRLDANAIIDG